jgi:hypothetical protein
MTILELMERVANGHEVPINDAYEVILQFTPEDERLSSWEYNGYNTTVRDGIRGDDNGGSLVEKLTLSVTEGQLHILIYGGYEDVDNSDTPVSIVIETIGGVG